MVPLMLLFAGLGVATLAAAAEPDVAEGSLDAGAAPPAPPPDPAHPSDPAPPLTLDQASRLEGHTLYGLGRFAPPPVLLLPPDRRRVPGVDLSAHAPPGTPVEAPEPSTPRYVVEPSFAAHLLERAEQAIGHGPLHRQALPALARAKESGEPNRLFEAGRHWIIEAAIVGIDHGLNHLHKPDTRWSLKWIDEVLSLAALCLTEAELNPGLGFEERYAQTRVAVQRLVQRSQDCWHMISGLKADNRYWTHFLKAISPEASRRSTRAKHRCRATMEQLRDEEKELHAYGERPPLRVLGQFFKRFAFLRRVTWLD